MPQNSQKPYTPTLYEGEKIEGKEMVKRYNDIICCLVKLTQHFMQMSSTFPLWIL